MTIPYFPILEPEDSEEYQVEWPLIQVQFEKRYSERRSLGYKLRTWKVTFMLFDTFDDGSLRAWQNGSYAVGQYVRPTIPNGYVYLCATAGASGAAEPVWPVTAEATVTDGAVTWVCFTNDQIQAVFDFIDNRRGRTGMFKVYIPIIDTWVNCVLPEDGVRFKPVKSGIYRAVKADILFEEIYGSAS